MVRADGSYISIGISPWKLQLSRCLFGVVLWLATYLVYWIGPIIDVVRANLDFTIGGGFWNNMGFYNVIKIAVLQYYRSTNKNKMILTSNTCTIDLIGDIWWLRFLIMVFEWCILTLYNMFNGQEIAILMTLLVICEVNYFYFHARKSENRAAAGKS